MGVYTHSDGNWLTRRGTFLVLLILFHILLLWALKSGFAVRFLETITKPIAVQKIEEVKPEEPPPPPPPSRVVELPPVSVPPVLVDIQIPVETPPIVIALTPSPPGPPAPPAYGPPAPPAPSGPVGTPMSIRFKPDTIDYYPPAAIQLQEEGRPIVKICWDVKGNVISSEVAEGTGKKRLDDAAVKYGKNVKFKPATSDGKTPITGCARLPVVFTLKDVK